MDPGNITKAENIYHSLFLNHLSRQNSVPDISGQSNADLAHIRSDESLTDDPVIRGALEPDEWILIQLDKFGCPSFHVTVSH